MAGRAPEGPYRGAAVPVGDALGEAGMVGGLMTGAVLASAVTFTAYGALCLFSGGMRAEFERFGLARFRRATGAVELLGGLGLVAGLLVPDVLLVAAAGLTVLMVLGVGVRLRVGDPWPEAVPAAVLALLNGSIMIAAMGSFTLP